MNKIETNKQLLIKVISHKATHNFIIVGLIAIFQVINNIILGRSLEKDEFGIYSFIFNSIVGVFSIVLLFGHNSSILRYFSSKNFLEYRWKQYLLRNFVLILLPLTVAMSAIKIIYDLNWFWFWMGFLSTYLMCTTNLVSSLLRSKELFITTILLERAHPIILTGLLLSIGFFFVPLNLWNSSYAKLISYSIQVPIVLFILLKWQEGEKTINKNVFKDNLAFWELNISVVVLTSIDAFFIVKILSFEELALFSIIISLMQIYEFTSLSIFHVYSQKFSKENNINIESFNRILLILIFLITTFYLLSTDFLLEILFKGKYEISLTLLILFCANSSIALLYTLPSCYIIGQSTTKELKAMFKVNLINTVIKIGLIFLLSGFGLSGFLIARLISQLIRTGYAYYMVVKNKQLKWSSLFSIIKNG